MIEDRKRKNQDNRVQRGTPNGSGRRRLEQGNWQNARARQAVSEMTPEGAVRRKVKVIYLSLAIISLAVIIVFAVLVKVKLKDIKAPPSAPNEYFFDENPRVTYPSSQGSANDGVDIPELDDEMLDDEG